MIKTLKTKKEEKDKRLKTRTKNRDENRQESPAVARKKSAAAYTIPVAVLMFKIIQGQYFFYFV